MMSRILQRSPNVHVFRELHFFERLWRSADADRILPKAEAVSLLDQLIRTSRRGVVHAVHDAVDPDEVTRLIRENGLGHSTALELFESFMHIHANREKPGSIPCDHTPKTGFYVGEILAKIPGSRIIRITRDPRDILVSQKHKWQRPDRVVSALNLGERLRLLASYHPLIIGKMWVSIMSRTDAWLGDPRMHTFRFEDFVRDPERHVRNLCTFLDIPYSSDLLDISTAGSSMKEYDPQRRGVDADRGGSWQRHGGINPTELYLCQLLAKKKMAQHGYALQSVFPNPLLLLLYLATFPLKLVAATLLNRGRIKSVREAIERRM